MVVLLTKRNQIIALFRSEISLFKDGSEVIPKWFRKAEPLSFPQDKNWNKRNQLALFHDIHLARIRRFPPRIRSPHSGPFGGKPPARFAGASRPNALRVSRAATFPKSASIRSALHNQFSPRYQAAAAASDCTRLLGSATMQGER